MQTFKAKVLSKNFFNRKTLLVAEDLVGKYLVRQIGKKIVREKITEVEAYVGAHDLASHSSKGRTARTEIMYGEAGTLYVYFIYGMYFMLNVVTEEKDYPAAVLIRGTESFKGPGILTRELGIDKNLNGKPASRKTGLWFENPPLQKLRRDKVKKSPRIGVKYAGPIWSEKKYRFYI